ncbi:hypothetical protein CVT26_003271 [Gymnopilus dilepis]|uniref:CxC2-like cysteine cluster KDZ transposase-associated domain-containing protein n=1 Tax=Gymnopilus dilepis TaxID=231916 RepID=A0A409Y565_9AGAR|nr:hypothetical protein CVT26_003271 [Gymnopilus dilepis]
MKRAKNQARKRTRQSEFEDLDGDAPTHETSTCPSGVSLTTSAASIHPESDSAKRPRLDVPFVEDPNRVADEQVLKRVYTKPQGASAAMDTFIPKFGDILHSMMAAESPPSVNQPCHCGRSNAFRTCHCNDCTFFQPCCSGCFIKSHQHVPYHWAEVWNGNYFERKDISSLGYTITYGHDASGGQCPHAKPFDFTLVDLNGVHQTKIALCSCIGKFADRFSYLIQSRIFPATVAQPQIGFTFALLKDFHLQTLTSKKSPYDYLFAIRHKTNNTFIDEVPNPYSQFLRVQRIWRALTLVKNSGQAHNIDRYFPLRRPGSVIVPCFACPEPDFNVPEDQWGSPTDETKFLNTLFIMKDGHFGLQRLAKTGAEDPDDVSLLEGNGLFPRDDDYNPYVRDIVAYSEEKTTCSKFSAVEMQNKIKFKGAIITGVVAVECMRHVFFLAMADLQKGERYANGDYVLAYFLRRWLIWDSLQRIRYFRRIVETYDVACQYYVHLRARFESSFPDLADVIDLMYLLVPKKHLDGHIDRCKYRFSLNYTDGVGRSHGEGIEPSWAESKQSGGSTRQMNHGHRHDTINDLHNYWNWNKLRGLGRSLSDNLRKAFETRDAMIDHFLGLSILRGEENVKLWEKEDREPRLVDGEWESVYRLKEAKLPSQAAIFQSLEVAEKAQKDTSLPGHSTSTSRLLHMGIKLQEKQHDLRHMIRYPPVGVVLNLASRRQTLAAEISTWRKSQLRTLPQLEGLVVDLDPNTEPEDETLLLPSDIPFDSHDQFGIAPLIPIEYQLREGQANDAVSSLCNTIMHGMLLREAKTAHARGVYQNTRALKFINAVKDKKATWTSRYRTARAKAIILSQSDPKTLSDFPELKDEDTYAKNAATARSIGDGAKTDSWIWTYGRLKGLSQSEQDDFTLETKKVQWHRAHADMMRWVEEVDLLEEEFRRLIRGLERMATVWHSLSSSPMTSASLKYPTTHYLASLSPSGYIAYASRKSAIYGKMASKERKRFEGAGGQWPQEDESLSESVMRRRPALTVDWEEVRKEMANENTERGLAASRPAAPKDI